VQPLRSTATGPLAGDIVAPGDKSISHRALLLGALTAGRTAIDGLLAAEDTLATAAAVSALGAPATCDEDGRWHVAGVGIGGLGEPGRVLDLGNSGTGARLLLGVLAGQPLTAVLTGDASLRSRPMARVTEPLSRMGARFVCAEGGRLPITVTGATDALALETRLAVPSAQVKSALLLAGLAAAGQTTIVEPEPTRDHSERMLRLFGAEVGSEAETGGGRRITLSGQPELVSPGLLTVPGDPSSAAFPLVAALLVPGSRLRIGGVCINPLRSGLYESLVEMGAALSITESGEACGETVADISASAGPLRGVTVPAGRAPRMIDEYPVLAVAAACAEGPSRFEGLAELRVKESDRLAAIADGLAANGVAVEADADSLTITGAGGPPPGGGRVVTHGDHRIAMAFLVLGLVAQRPVSIDDGAMIATSFPGFAKLMRGLGADIAAADEA
jgi:3-phosphoshikimate 1-carboxyvinyltransferase